LRPIEITILALSIVFILATITLIFIICRLKGIHLCLKIKNYLFYGKKYGLSNAQRLSADKMTVKQFFRIIFQYLFIFLAKNSFNCCSRISITFNQT
jgi:hypothetical protein